MYQSYRPAYRSPQRRPKRSGRKFLSVLALALLVLAAFGAYKLFAPTPVERAVNKLQFASSVSEADKQAIRQAIKDQSKTYSGSVTVRVESALETPSSTSILSAYLPVTNVYATRQQITQAELSGVTVYVPSSMDKPTRASIAKLLGLTSDKLSAYSSLEDLSDSAVAFIPVSDLSPHVKLLTFEGSYYLDSFQKGAVFRRAVFSGGGASGLAGLKLNNYAAKDATLKINQTGVTALTRDMMKKLGSVKEATYFSKLISDFLADADITHVSNEVSFKPGCGYSTTSFCAPPEMIDTLKASGVDLVELTGNHNNDTGNQYNTDSIKLYQSLGWHTFGGGLNATEAAKPYIADLKGSKVAFLGYNYADAPQSGAVATSTIAGANHFDWDKIKTDISSAKQSSDFIVVDVQFWECYAYPDGFVEYPQCDVPIPTQEDTFRRLIDMGADMVVGTQAHQPQTYELYKGKPIYYGLGNLYFEQTRWPGTERGIILTHYFVGGKLVQTKLTPTVYDQALQTHIMTSDGAAYLLGRLKTARQTAGL